MDEYGETALHEAVGGQKLAAVNVLLQHGANPHAKTAFKQTVLHIAAKEDDEDEGDNEEEEKEDDGVLKQKIISLLENWNKPEQQTAA